jgi:vesicle coat complex subunit
VQAFDLQDIFRCYPNRYEAAIGPLCEALDVLEEPDAKAAMVWIVGEYAERIDNAEDMLTLLLDTFLDEPVPVQLQLLTATVKLS